MPARTAPAVPSAKLIDAVWQHGRVMPEADPDEWRQDECGAWMRRDEYGREESDFGWRMEKYARPPRNRPL